MKFFALQIHQSARTWPLIPFLFLSTLGFAREGDWYTQGKFHPVTRCELILVNTLDFDRVDSPVIVSRQEMPVQDIFELWITVVDPALPSSPEPSNDILARYGYHALRKEEHGHAIPHQLDDLDKDGIWDELCFQTDIPANASKPVYIYFGFNDRGWNPHGTHAGIGSYCRHLVPFWESKHVGWKLWYPTDCDVYAKRTSQLISDKLYMENLDGYGVPYDMGSDIMSVSNSFGGGGIGIFEYPEYPDSISRPRFTPEREEQNFTELYNVGQISDTRYAYDVIVNGPVRSMVKVKTLNWKTLTGFYELEQLYSVYANQSYSTCDVKFTRLENTRPDIQFGCGISKKPGEKYFYQSEGIVITAGPETIQNPDDVDGIQSQLVDGIYTALIVKDVYKPVYHFLPSLQGNHVFKISRRRDSAFAYLIAAGWSEGSVFHTYDDFKTYILRTAREYNSPIVVEVKDVEQKTISQ